MGLMPMFLNVLWMETKTMLPLVSRLTSCPSSATDGFQTGFLETSLPPCAVSTSHWKMNPAKTMPYQDRGNSCCYGEGAEHIFMSSCYIFIIHLFLEYCLMATMVPSTQVGSHSPICYRHAPELSPYLSSLRLQSCTTRSTHI